MREPFIEAMESVEHRHLIGDELTNITKGVSEGLDLVVVGGDCHVALNENSELTLEVKCTVCIFVEEDIFSAGPKSTRGLTRFHNDVRNFHRDRIEEPREDSEVLLCPFEIGRARVGVVNVMHHDELSQHGGK